MADPVVRLPLLRGSHEGADCDSCPFSTGGMPTKPVYSEHPEDPKWIIIGEGPGFTEQRVGRPFIGPSGQVVNKMLAKIGRPREDVFVGNITLCMPPQGSPEAERQAAAKACKQRLVNELAQFPGKPVLTLGAVAARALIPQDVLEAIDPPDTPKAIKRGQKMRSIPTLKNAIKRRKSISKETDKQLAKLLKHERTRIITTIKVRHKQRPPESYIQGELNRVHAQLQLKAREQAIKVVDLKIKERALKKKLDEAKPKKKSKKPKAVKITDICGTLFEVDIGDGAIRPLIPGIHPAALLRGGGASIGGSHTPDMAYVNLTFDAVKIDMLAKGIDIRLKLNIEYELDDRERAFAMFMRVYNDALLEDACSLDLETYVDDENKHHALMAYMARIRVLGLATQKMAVSLSWDLLPPICHSLLQLLLQRVEMTFHNGLYDKTVLRAYGFTMGPRWFDTLLAHHAAFPGNAHRLQIVTAQFMGTPAWKSEFRNAQETPEKLAIYNATDTGSTHALRAPLTRWIQKTGTKRVFDLDLKMSDTASRMHLLGMPVDREINAELRATFGKQVIESRREVEDIAKDPKIREEIWHHLSLQQAGKKRKLDPDDFEARYKIRLSAMQLDPDWKWKIGASKHIAALLLAMGVGLYQTTASGDISTKKDVLESLTDVPVVRSILNYREADKLKVTFVDPIFDRCDPTGQILQYGFADENDRIHPIWSTHLISGRWASRWPVVSNVAKDKWKKLTGDALFALTARTILPEYDKNKAIVLKLDDGTVVRVNKDASISIQTRPNLRTQVRCKPGRMLVGFDYAAIEARVIGLISGDDHLCRIFSDPKLDIHTENSRAIWANFDTLDPDSRKQIRDQSKPITYGFFYLAQAETLHKQILKDGGNIKLADLVKALASLSRAMSGVMKWQRDVVAQAMTPPHEIRDFVLGRRRVWPMGQVEGTEACNAGVQFAAAGIMNEGMARMMPMLDDSGVREAGPIAQIHDAAVFECWEDDAERVGEMVDEAFPTEYERNGRLIKFPIERKIAKSWDKV